MRGSNSIFLNYISENRHPLHIIEEKDEEEDVELRALKDKLLKNCVDKKEE